MSLRLCFMLKVIILNVVVSLYHVNLKNNYPMPSVFFTKLTTFVNGFVTGSSKSPEDMPQHQSSYFENVPPSVIAIKTFFFVTDSDLERLHKEANVIKLFTSVIYDCS